MRAVRARQRAGEPNPSGAPDGRPSRTVVPSSIPGSPPGSRAPRRLRSRPRNPPRRFGIRDKRRRVETGSRNAEPENVVLDLDAGPPSRRRSWRDSAMPCRSTSSPPPRLRLQHRERRGQAIARAPVPNRSSFGVAATTNRLPEDGRVFRCDAHGCLDLEMSRPTTRTARRPVARTGARPRPARRFGAAAWLRRRQGRPLPERPGREGRCGACARSFPPSPGPVAPRFTRFLSRPRSCHMSILAHSLSKL